MAAMYSLKTPLAFLFLILLSACTSNFITTLPAEKNTTFRKNERYINQYAGEKTYPITCQQDCYTPRQELSCEINQPATQCHYIADQIRPILNTGFAVKWLGHASFQLTTGDNQHILIDPVFDQFDWPVDVAFKWSGGLYRQQPAQLSDTELRKTNAVLYSHLHYDHFNKTDLASIGTKPTYYVPLDMADYFPSGGYNITELPWYSQQKQGKLTIHSVPAHHFNSRYLIPFYNDDEQALWGGWIIEYQGHTLFFAGDTGYSRHFKDIQQRYGDIDVCLMPIASYHSEQYPKWYRYVHTTPEDALTAAADLNCKVMIPWGYGNATWQMGDKSSHSAMVRLLNMHEQMNSSVPLYILNEGEAIAF